MKKINGVILGALMSGALSANLVAAIAVGVGSDSSFLVLESPNVGVRTYEVFYDFDDSSPLGTDDLMTIVEGADNLIAFSFGGDPENQFLMGITFDGVMEFSDFSDSNNFVFWSQWVAGGEAGARFDSESATFVPDPQPVDGGDWSFGSGVSAPFRIVEPGASDALVFGDGNMAPSVSPIPEPSSGVLLFGSALLLVIRRRRTLK